MNLMRANIVLAVAAAGLAVPTWLTIQADRTEFTSFEDIPKLFPGFTPDNVKAVVISTVKKGEDGEPVKDQNGKVQRDGIQLQRTDDGWVLANTDIAGVKVRPEVVRDRVFDNLDRIRVDDKAIVRENATPDELKEFGLAEDQAVLVQCFDAANRPLAQLLIGKDAAGGKAGKDVVRGFYVRSADSSDVVLYEQSYWQIDADRDQWVDRMPVHFDVDKAVHVELHNPKGDVAFERSGVDSPDWKKVAGPDDVGAVRNGEVRAFVQTISQIQVQKYVKRLPPVGPQRTAAVGEFGLATPEVTVTVKLADGTEHRVAVGSQVQGQNQYYLMASSADFLLAVGDWIVSPLERDPATFFDPPASRVTGPGDQPKEGAPAETTPKEQAPGDATTPEQPPKDAKTGAAPKDASKAPPADTPGTEPKH